MRIIPIAQDQIRIPSDRQRKEILPEHTVSLATSISSTGLIHPISLRKTDSGWDLVAGECRMKAIEYLWAMGETVRCGKEVFKEGFFPCLDQGTLTDLEAYEIELSENIERLDLSWQDKARATSQFLELKRLQAEKAGEPEPNYQDIAQELRPQNTRIAALDTARKEIIISKQLGDEDVAAAPTLEAAYKIAKRKEELRESARLGVSVGKTFSSADHQLVKGECISWMSKQGDELYDVILTDPPYGMGADSFGDSGGKAKGEHFYIDSQIHFRTLLEEVFLQIGRLAKPQAHLYLFCDIDQFPWLKALGENQGWNVFRTPLIWINPTANRAPWPEQGPMRKWQAILYANKGKKLCTKLAPDVLTFASDTNLNHQAQKPVELYRELLSRSCRPGDSVLDPFCGTGPIFPAAHALKVKATGIELDDSAYGIAVKRLGDLK